MKTLIADIPEARVDNRPTEAKDHDEVWNGEVHMAAMANRFHQRMVRQLQNWLDQHWAKPSGGDVEQEVNVTTPEDEQDWRSNYRIPDLVLLDPPRFPIDKIAYMAGAPLICVEIYSPGDESYDKLDFYAGLGVPEVWIIHRDTKVPEVYKLVDGSYEVAVPDSEGWVISTAVNVAMKPSGAGKLVIRMTNDPATLAELPDR